MQSTVHTPVGNGTTAPWNQYFCCTLSYLLFGFELSATHTLPQFLALSIFRLFPSLPLSLPCQPSIHLQCSSRQVPSKKCVLQRSQPHSGCFTGDGRNAVHQPPFISRGPKVHGSSGIASTKDLLLSQTDITRVVWSFRGGATRPRPPKVTPTNFAAEQHQQGLRKADRKANCRCRTESGCPEQHPIRCSREPVSDRCTLCNPSPSSRSPRYTSWLTQLKTPARPPHFLSQ